MRWLVLILALAACGADGEPEPVDGVSVSGKARIGVVGKL